MPFNKLKNNNYLGIITSSKDIAARDCAVQWAEANEEIKEITNELNSQKYTYVSGGTSSEHWPGLVDWIDDTNGLAFGSFSYKQDLY